MSLNKLIAGVAIAGLTILTSASVVPVLAGEKTGTSVSSQQTDPALTPQSRNDRGDRENRYCYRERYRRGYRYCCREKVWNGHRYYWRTVCRLIRR